MYNRNIIVEDSTRIKLKVAKYRIDDRSKFSESYIRLYNNSLRSNYRLWLSIEKKIILAWGRLFGDFRPLDPIRWIGRLAIDFFRGRDYGEKKS